MLCRHGYYGEWDERIDSRQVDEPEKWYQSACVLCSNGCAMDIGVKGNQVVAVRGRGVDRVNRGRLGPKGMHASIGLNQHQDRLLYPQIRNPATGKLERATWDEAMELIVNKTKETIKQWTAHAIGFYSTGQLMLEEYYALAIIGKAGISTNHMDGNTRLCTATAAASMRESFGSDGQIGMIVKHCIAYRLFDDLFICLTRLYVDTLHIYKGSYTDIDTTECIMLVGHNMAATQTVLWSRILDRLAGPKPPQIICIDPRVTPVAEAATVHLQPNIGTNVAILNGIQRYLIEHAYIDSEFVNKHTVGVDELWEIVKKYTPEYVCEVSNLDLNLFIKACEILGKCKSLLSTALQGVYQSYQATAAACQINNINLLRGMIGRPGCGVLQMNGQPTAQNNRECGCDGEYTGFRNHQNPAHVNDLATHWNVEPETISHWSVPTHIMQMLHYIENHTIKMFWIIGTNPVCRVLCQSNIQYSM